MLRDGVEWAVYLLLIIYRIGNAIWGMAISSSSSSHSHIHIHRDRYHYIMYVSVLMSWMVYRPIGGLYTRICIWTL